MTHAVEIAVAPEVSEAARERHVPKTVFVYERRRWPYLLALPLMWLLTVYVMVKKAVYKTLRLPGPRVNSLWFDGLGCSPRKVKEGAASWQALDEIYNYDFKGPLSLAVAVDNFWEGMLNCQAVRNRFKLARQEVRRAILRFSNHEEVRLISLACGSAQAVIEIMAEFKAAGVTVRTILVDIDQVALDYARDLAVRYGVADQMETYRASAAQVVKLSRGFKPQIVEMLGLLDYISQDKAIRLAEKIRQSLEPKGVFLTCNIAPNPERHFLKWVVNWPMIYRTAGDLAEISREAGFSDCRLIYEPLRIHGLLIAQKD